MKYLMMLILGLLSVSAHADTTGDDWLCKNIASEKRGNSIYSCGVGQGHEQQHAMDDAFLAAKHEFSNICDMSSDCKNHKLDVEAKRSECVPIPEVVDGGAGSNYLKFTCYRLVVFTIQ